MSNYNYSNNLGFLGFGSSNNVTEALVQQRSHPLGDTIRTNFIWSANKREATIKRMIGVAYEAYATEGIIKQAVDKFSEQFKDFGFEGNAKAIKYLTTRLNMMAVQMGEDWRQFISRVVNEYFKTGNVFILKYRGWNFEAAQRPLYENKPFTLSGIQLIASDRVDPHYNNDNVFDGWVIRDMMGASKVNLLSDKASRLNKDLALVDVYPIPSEVNVLYPGIDVAHVTYKKGADTRFGMGMILPGCEDWSLLRGLELNVAVMIKKFSMPTLHHKVKRNMTPLAGQQNEIRDAYQLHQRMGPDGIIITGDNHEIIPIGSESQAMRCEGYLKYYMTRACASIGTSPYLMGIESGSLGTLDAATEDMLNRVRWVQKDISRQLEFCLFNEILWEGGFDPYRNENDRVVLTFDDVDLDSTIKQESHAADLFNKNAIDHNQLQTRIKNKKPVDEKRLYINMIDKPRSQHEAEVKTTSQIAINKSKPKPKKAKVREHVLSVLPETVEDIESFILFMEKKFGYEREELETNYTSMCDLIEDQEAFISLITELLGDQS